MSEPKPINAQLRDLTIAWVDALYEKKSAALLDDIYRRAQASRDNGFKKGHEHHKPGSKTK